MSRVIGILGGMGPEATVDLYLKIIRATPATCDQEHLRVIIDSNPAIPDRTMAIEGRGPDPVPAMVATARNLERAGADFVLIPCNTAHYFLASVRDAVRIPVLNMIELTVAEVGRMLGGSGTAGLLATSGTIRTRLYQDSLARLGVEVVVPGPASQDEVMAAIRLIKAGNLAEGRVRLVREADRLVTAGAKALILGCTEVPLVIKEGDVAVPTVDPAAVLARAAVDYALSG